MSNFLDSCCCVQVSNNRTTTTTAPITTLSGTITTNIGYIPEPKTASILNIYKNNRKEQLEYDKKEELKNAEKLLVSRYREELLYLIKVFLEDRDGDYTDEQVDSFLKVVSDNFPKNKKILDEINKINKLFDNLFQKLEKEIQEIRQFLLTAETYEQELEILRNYEVLDKQGRIKKC